MRKSSIKIKPNSSTSSYNQEDLNESWYELSKKNTSEIKALKEAIQSLGVEYSTLFKNIQSAEKDAEKLKKEIANDKIRAIEIIGIFIALFTYSSSEISILREVDSGWKLFSISIVFFSGLILFSYLIFIITEKWINKEDQNGYYQNEHRWFPTTIVIILIISGIIWFYSSSEKILNKRIEILEQKINELEIIKTQNPYKYPQCIK